jgi:hypothetical protein
MEIGNWKMETGKWKNKGCQFPVSNFQFLARLALPLCSFFFPEARGCANFNGHVGAPT